MKRHPALVALSHDHHHGLVQARRLRRGAQEGDRREVARAYLRFFQEETVDHFREEEELLFPAFVDMEEAREPVARALLEHQRLRGLAARLTAEVESGIPSAALVSELGDVLERHIRYEERQLFPLLERLPAALAARPSPSPPGEQGAIVVGDLTGVVGEGPVWGMQSGDLNATLLVWPAGHRVRRHVNEQLDVLLVVVTGSAEVTVGPRSEHLRGGQALLVPKGEPREVVAGEDGVRYLSVHRRRQPLRIGRATPLG